jgi:hypothetical protein
MRYTDQELINAFQAKTPIGMKRWQVCFYPRRDASVDHTNDKIVFFSAPNRIDAQQIAAEYAMRINESLVRWIYQAK